MNRGAVAGVAGSLADICSVRQPMSALGQKQTHAVQRRMSALPPNSDRESEFPQKSCPLYPRKRTCAVQLGMSALGQ